MVLNGPNPGIISSSEQTEAELDVEWAGAVAKNAAIQFVLSASTSTTDGALLSAQYTVNQNVAPVISLSFGQCEAAIGASGNQMWNSLWQQAAAQGMTVLMASGDSGAAGCDSPSETKAVQRTRRQRHLFFSLQYLRGRHAVQRSRHSQSLLVHHHQSRHYGSALSYIPELVWNTSDLPAAAPICGPAAGARANLPKPAWQVGIGVPADGHRDVPDLAVTASSHDGYLFVLPTDEIYIVAGTSASTPSLAGLMALAVQRAGARQGNANPTLYALAAQSNRMAEPAVFHDYPSRQQFSSRSDGI